MEANQGYPSIPPFANPSLCPIGEHHNIHRASGSIFLDEDIPPRTALAIHKIPSDVLVENHPSL
jgi:hypothetical protein